MKILHIVAGVWPGSGIAEVVAGLSSATRLQGHDVTVVTLDGPMAASIEKAQAMGVRVVRFKPSQPHFLFYSWAMLRGLGQEVREADVVHVHGCWTFPVWFGAWLALRYKKTLVMSPHGSFNPLQLQHSAWKKKLVGWMDRWLLRRASVIHATCEAEGEWVRKFLEPQNPQKCTKKIVVIPNGVGEVLKC
jgi:glycosyltransferase involved in cell wall biosynthesis